MSSTSPVAPFKPLVDERYDYLFKLLVVGDSAVGKTSLLQQFCFERFSLDQKSTIGVEFYTKTIAIANQVVKCQCWDTAGQERYRSVTPSFYRGALGVAIVYDSTFVKSFENVQFWLNQIQQYCPSAKLLLLSNKTDLPDLRAVPLDVGERHKTKTNQHFIHSNTHGSFRSPLAAPPLPSAQTYAEEQNLAFVEASAKDLTSVTSAFTTLTSLILADKNVTSMAQETFSSSASQPHPDQKPPSLSNVIKLKIDQQKEKKKLSKLDKWGISRKVGKQEQKIGSHGKCC